MGEFFSALLNPDLAFLRYTLVVGLLASASFGIVGTYVVARRLTYIAAAISHCVLGGIGPALYLKHACGVTWMEPMYGAVAAALLSALVIGLVSLYAREREDTVIGAVWAVGMAIGLLFIARTPGYIDPMSYLFGDILLVSRRDVWLILMLDAVVVGLGLFFFNKFVAVCFDEEYAELRGIRVQVYHLFLLCLTALTVVLLVTVVGIVMVIALLTLPAATAGQFSRRIWQMMLLSVLFCMAFTGGGIALSYGPGLPTGPTIIMVGGVTYLVALLAKRLLRRTN
ncbi:MAG: metal ABC transporter permease [bacterium]|nr:metal ABC transporter permease [bacterium]